jgi:hypothetical protein
MEVVGTNEFTSKYQSILIILTATANYIKILTLSYVGRGTSIQLDFTVKFLFYLHLNLV